MLYADLITLMFKSEYRMDITDKNGLLWLGTI